MQETGPGAPNTTIQTDNVTVKLSLQYSALETLHFVPRGTVADIYTLRSDCVMILLIVCFFSRRSQDGVKRIVEEKAAKRRRGSW